MMIEPIYRWLALLFFGFMTSLIVLQLTQSWWVLFGWLAYGLILLAAFILMTRKRKMPSTVRARMERKR